MSQHGGASGEYMPFTVTFQKMVLEEVQEVRRLVCSVRFSFIHLCLPVVVKRKVSVSTFIVCLVDK